MDVGEKQQMKPLHGNCGSGFTRRRTYSTGARPPHAPSSRAPPRPPQRSVSAPPFTRREVRPLPALPLAVPAESLKKRRHGAGAPGSALDTVTARAGRRLAREAVRLCAVCAGKRVPCSGTDSSSSSGGDAAVVSAGAAPHVSLVHHVDLPRIDDCLDGTTSVARCTLVHASMLLPCSTETIAAVLGSGAALAALCASPATAAAVIPHVFHGGAQALIHVTAAAARDAVFLATMQHCSVAAAAPPPVGTAHPPAQRSVSPTCRSPPPRLRHRIGGSQALVCACASVDDPAIPLQYGVARSRYRHVSWVARATLAHPAHAEATELRCTVAYDAPCKGAGTPECSDSWVCDVRGVMEDVARRCAAHQRTIVHRGRAPARFAPSLVPPPASGVRVPQQHTRVSSAASSCLGPTIGTDELQARREMCYRRLSHALDSGAVPGSAQERCARRTDVCQATVFRRDEPVHRGRATSPPKMVELPPRGSTPVSSRHATSTAPSPAPRRPPHSPAPCRPPHSPAPRRPPHSPALARDDTPFSSGVWCVEARVTPMPDTASRSPSLQSAVAPRRASVGGTIPSSTAASVVRERDASSTRSADAGGADGDAVSETRGAAATTLRPRAVLPSLIPTARGTAVHAGVLAPPALSPHCRTQSPRTRVPPTPTAVQGQEKRHRSASWSPACERTTSARDVRQMRHRQSSRSPLRRLLSAPAVAPLTQWLEERRTRSPIPAHPAAPVRHVALLAVCAEHLVDERGLPMLTCTGTQLRVDVAVSSVCGAGDGRSADDGATADEKCTVCARYDGSRAMFKDDAGSEVVLSLPVHDATTVVVTFTLWQGTRDAYEEVGTCTDSIAVCSTATARGGGGGRSTRSVTLVRQAGTAAATVAGTLTYALQTRDKRVGGVPRGDPPKATSRAVCDTALQDRVLLHLWYHHGRQHLHRLAAMTDAAACGGTVPRALAAFTSLRDRRRGLVDTVAASSDVCVIVRDAELCMGTAEHQHQHQHQQRPSLQRWTTVRRLFLAWSCACFTGRSQEVALRPLLRVANTAPVRLDTPLRFPHCAEIDSEELCLVLYGVVEEEEEGGAEATVELCRSHVLVRSLRSCVCASARGGRVVRLPLVWCAGERGAYEQGHLHLCVPCVPSARGERGRDERCNARWAGFDSAWPTRRALTALLECYATERLHLALPLLAAAEGDERRFVERLEQCGGPTGSPVHMRVCLVGWRSFLGTEGHRGRGCYLKVYHGDRSVLRTPTLATSVAASAGRPLPPLAEWEGRQDVVPLLDEDKYLFHVAMRAPHSERLLLKLGVDHALWRNDVVGFAEVSLAACVRLDDAAVGESRRQHFWIPLQNHMCATVAEVGVRVEWVRGTAAAASAGRAPPMPSASPVDGAAARDVLSLLRAYRPSAICRWSCILGRFPDASLAHRRLRAELLSPQFQATVYVDVAGISPRRQAAAGWGRDTAFAVTATYPGCAAAQPCRCRCLSTVAARATVEASAVFSGDGDGHPWSASAHTLRLDLRWPSTPPGRVGSSADAHDALRLTFATERVPQTVQRRGRLARSSSAGPRQRLSSRSSSADQFRQLRCDGALAPDAPPTLGGAQTRSASCATTRRAPGVQEGAVVGRVHLSLKALCTTPSLYRSGETVVVPLVAADTAGSTQPLLGDVYLRVRTPAYEPVPPWLRYTDDEVHEMLDRDTLTRRELHTLLARRQLQLERAAVGGSAVELERVHATFFSRRGARRAAALGAAVEPVASRAPPTPPTTQPHPPPLVVPEPAVEVQWNRHVVQPRAQVTASVLSTDSLPDATPPGKHTISQTATTSEVGGATGGGDGGGSRTSTLSSWRPASSLSARSSVPSVSVLQTKRELIF
ncbi:hypothetical protein NESM_000114000 [Novymonas esmeraldas]|uniref:Uncharacterized protein n=1 Tax=Novymonas esmeraldas TaxID=1808958 RepID=A0AAW0F423_9TRYP